MRLRITTRQGGWLAGHFRPFLVLDLSVKLPLDDALRRAISDSGLSGNEIARRTGVPQGTISRFLAGTDMRISKAAKIAACLGLSLKK